MKIYHALTKGEFHTHHCEDFLVIENISSTTKLIAVMDGCSMGKESVFASHLFGKVLRAIAKQNYYKDFVVKSKNLSLKTKLKEVLEELFQILNTMQRSLYLETHEMLSTLILGLVDTKEQKAEILCVGDGLVVVDGQYTAFEQNDKPDYLGYHLQENFTTWFEKHNQFLSVASFTDLSVCTDGIYSFKNLKNKEKKKEENEIMDFFLIDKEEELPANFLDRKVISLEKADYVPTDDLAIIRVIKEIE